MGFLSECTSGGCGAKIGAGDLTDFLSRLPVKKDPNLLVGFDGHDDAAVYRLDERTGIVSTVDFFSPMVDEPYLFGKIAAANALSDVYAMGGTPLFALNLVCFPHRLDMGILREILSGGAQKALEADTVIAGGHSIYDHEPKYGLAVTGRVHLDRGGGFLRNDTCREGDALLLTKALGVGLVMSAGREHAAPPDVMKAATDSMERLNRYAAECMAAFPVHACTDVTGFGLLVHASEMAGEAHSVVLECAKLPVLPGAGDFARNYVTSGGQRNRAYMTSRADLTAVPPALAEIMLDPQTSGGLLIAVEADKAPPLREALRTAGCAAAEIIGNVTARQRHPVVLI